MKLKVSQVIGLNTDQKASQVISAIRDADNSFFAVLNLTCDDAFTKGRQILSDLSDFYFDFEGSSSEKLTATFTEGEKKLITEEFSLSLAAISGKVLYLIGKGELQMYLKREGSLSALLPVESSGQIISGFLSQGDRLLFATKTLIDFLGSDLSKSLELPIDEFEEEITARIGGTPLEEDGLAGLAIEIEQEVAGEEIIPGLSKEEFLKQEGISKSVVLKKILKSLFKKILLLKAYFPKSNRGRLIIAVALILIITLGVGYKYKSSKDHQRDAQFNQSMQQARDDFNGAKSLSTLNPKQAKDRLDLAKKEVTAALSLKPKDNDANDLKKQIEGDSSSILQQVSLSDFPLFLDMDLVKKNFRATQMSLSSGKLLLLDPGVKTLVTIDITKKSNQILAGSEALGDASSVSLNGGMAFIYSKDKGVLKIDTTNQKLTTVAKKDLDLGTVADIYGFGGNIYLLDSSKSAIWKYLPTSDGYSDKRAYLAADVKVDLSNSLRMQIESSVYVLKQGGEILRFTRGIKDNFSIGGLDKNIKDPKSFFVSSDSDNLYVLDSGNSRLLILTKTGSYKGSISGDKFGTASDLVVDEQGKKVYLLDGSKIYTVDLK